MEFRQFLALAFAAGTLWLAVPGYAQETPAPGGGPKTATPADQQIYGWQLMTPQERATYREKMRSLTTQQEREQFRIEHHRLMQERAKERGVTLPDQPRSGGSGMGPGSGMMGPGSGMGPGSRMGPGGRP